DDLRREHREVLRRVAELWHDRIESPSESKPLQRAVGEFGSKLEHVARGQDVAGVFLVSKNPEERHLQIRRLSVELNRMAKERPERQVILASREGEGAVSSARIGEVAPGEVAAGGVVQHLNEVRECLGVFA